MIVACSENRVIGKNGELPWSIPEDTAYFHEKVRGGIVITGRKSFGELGKPLPETDTIVLSRDPLYAPRGVLTALSLPLSLQLAQTIDGDGPIWICGGQAVYEEGLSKTDRLYLTLVHAEVDGDTFFPDWRPHFPVKLGDRMSSNAHYTYTFYEWGPISDKKCGIQ